MKGVLMKLGQMASYIDDDMPLTFRAAMARLRHRAPPMSATPSSSVVKGMECTSGSVSERIKSRIVWIIRSTGAVIGDQPVEHILVDLDLSLFHQGVLHSGFKERVAFARLLAQRYSLPQVLRNADASVDRV